jgi:hypothetical protein
MAMDIQSLKLELVKQILNLESKDLINRLFLTLKKEDQDFISKLSDDQRREVELGMKQIENNETEDWDGFLRRVS